MSRKGETGFVSVVLLLCTLSSSSAERLYEYEVTVGPGESYDFSTINAAIEYVNDNRSSPDDLACIWVYPGTYEEQLNDPYKLTAPPPPDGDGQEHWFNLGCNSLPVNCDLRKPTSGSEEVKIIHSSPPTQYGISYQRHIGRYGVDCKGNNVLEGLTVENWFGSAHPGHYVQTSVGMNGYGEIRDCILLTGHGPAINGSAAGLVVSGCTVAKCYYYPCIIVRGPFSISDCVLTPTWSWVGQLPSGISAAASGTIERVIINGRSQSAAGSNNDYGFVGIRLTLQANDYVEILDSEINLEMRTKYDTNPDHHPQASHLRACGILSGLPWTDWPGGGGSYPGNAVVRDCTINVIGTEDDNGTPEEDDDGADIMVDGVCVRGGGTVEVLGCSRINTKRVPAGEQTVGYEYLLNNENGTLKANRATVLFNPNGIDPPDDYDPSYINGNITELWQLDGAFCVKNALGESVAWFDRCGNLILTGELTWGQLIGNAPENSFIIQDDSGDIVGYFDNQGNLFIEGNWQKMCASCEPTSNAFIIRNKSDKNVSYINFVGNLCLTGELRENIQP